MLRDYESSYIYKLQGKDVYQKDLIIGEFKERNATLDYSLGTKKIQEVANEVLAKSKADKVFFDNNSEKQCTNAIISVAFDYNIYEYNRIMIEDDLYYKHIDSTLTNNQIRDAYEMEFFSNGVYSDTIEPIEIVKIGETTNLEVEELPKGFKIEEGIILPNSSGCQLIANSKDIRKELYKDGFKLVFQRKGKKDEVVEYVRFIRSAGQARLGSCLFIMKKLYKPMMKWLVMELKIRKDVNIDLAGLEAYLSLCFSSIIDTVNIKSDQILVIDDYESVFNTKGMVTSDAIIDGKCRLVTEPKEFTQSNSIWDGQALLDSSLFDSNKYRDKGMLLLRNRFAKTCAFNTNIQTFFRDNNITDISQLKGFTKAKCIEDIKLITTPSSIKYVKYGTLEDYLDKVEDEWGIVKYDKPTHHFGGSMVQTHYQLLNTLEFDKETMEEFLSPTIEYIEKLKTDLSFLKKHLKIRRDSGISFTGGETKDEFIFKMLTIDSGIEKTKVFYKFRKNLVESYKKNVKRGHVLVEGNYSTLFGNGLEMLQASCGLFNEKSLLNVDEVYCKNFEYEAETVNSRSPHVANGNIWISKNCTENKANILNRYFNLSKQIVIINSMDNNVLETLSGADFDSDTQLMTDNPILLNLAKKNYGKFLTPTGNVKAKKANRKYTEEDKATLDIISSSNIIGKVINGSQIINSHIWECIKNGKIDKAQELYVITSQLDVMSNLAIDSAKREFDVDLKYELKIIEEAYIKVDLKPKFFEFIARDKGNVVKKDKFRWFDTSMDYLINIINTKTCTITNEKGEQLLSITDLILRNNKFLDQRINSSAVLNVVNKGDKAKKSINSIWSGSKPSSDKFFSVNILYEEFDRFIENQYLKPIDIKSIVYKLDKKEEYSRTKKFIIDTLFKYHPNVFLELFT